MSPNDETKSKASRWKHWFRMPLQRCPHVLGNRCLKIEGHDGLHRTYDAAVRHGFSWPSEMSTTND